MTRINLYTTTFTSTGTQTKKPRVSPSKVTGYSAIAAGLGSCLAANRKQFALHKNLAYLAGILSVVHIGVVEYFHHKYHPKG